MRALALLLLVSSAALAQQSPAQSKDWTLWACLPNRGPDGCLQISSPMGKTACILEMESFVKTSEKGTRFACVNVENIETGKAR